jgi:hypothetical protein
VIVFGRSPVLGQVKTRLATILGDQGALEAHRALLYNALRRAQQWHRQALATGENARLSWHVAGPINQECLALSQDLAIELKPQGEGSLGQRMRQALLNSLASGRRTLIVGADCADLSAKDLAEAMKALNHAEVVLAPALDGGYTLIGLHQNALARPLGNLFERPCWGQPTVLAQTLEAARDARLSVHLLRTMWDVDEAPDWWRWLRLEEARKVRPEGEVDS